MRRGYITGVEAQDVARVLGLLLTTAKHKPWEPPDVHPDSNHPEAYLDTTRLHPIDRLRIVLVRVAAQYLDDCLLKERFSRFVAAGRPIDNVPPVTLDELAAIHQERYANRMVQRGADEGPSLEGPPVVAPLHGRGAPEAPVQRQVLLVPGGSTSRHPSNRRQAHHKGREWPLLETRPLGTFADRARGFNSLVAGREEVVSDRANHQKQNDHDGDGVEHVEILTLRGDVFQP